MGRLAELPEIALFLFWRVLGGPLLVSRQAIALLDGNFVSLRSDLKE